MPSRLASHALGSTLGALALCSLGSTLFGGCSTKDHASLAPAASAGSVSSAGRSPQPGQAGGDGGAASGGAHESGGAASGGAEAGAGGATSSNGMAGDGQLAGPPGAAGDPGLSVDACPSDNAKTPPKLQSLCSTEKGWATGTDVAIADSDAPTFVAITPSELTLLWSQVASSTLAYFVADRDAVDGDFGEGQELPFSNPLALSPDGLRLTVLADDGSLAEAVRVARGDTFDAAQPGAYAELASDASKNHLALADIAIAADDHTLYYTAWSLDAATVYPLHVSSRSGSEPWPVGVALEACELKAYGPFGPRPTGVSADGLTLFYFDGARGTARAAFRATQAADFSWFAELPEISRPQPNAACDRLYFSPTVGEPRILTAARKP